MGNKNYTKYSENSKNNQHVVSEELEETVLAAGGEVIRVDQVEETLAVTEEEDGVHVRPVVDGEIIDTPVVEVIKPEEITEEETILPSNTKSIGVVTGCSKLNVRKEPYKDAEILCVINKNEEVEINTEEEATYEYFYKVITSKGVEGYCIKDFISIK